MDRGLLRAALWLLVPFALAPALAHVEIAPAFPCFLVWAGSAILGLLVAVVALAAAAWRFSGRRLAAAIVAAIPVAVIALAAKPGIGRPVLNDVSTDPAHPPALVAARHEPANRGRDLAYPSVSRELVPHAYPELRTLVLAEPPDRVFARVVPLVEGTPDTDVTYVNGAGRMVEAVAVSRLFRFRDDFVVRVRPANGGSAVDVRSRSRDGQGDFGVNAARVRRLLVALARS